MVKEVNTKWPDDDGEKTMAWLADGRERAEVGCRRVREILSGRPWLKSEVLETMQNSEEDQLGVDMFIQVDDRLVEFLGLWQYPELGVPIQVKSSNRAKRNFLREKGMVRDGRPVFSDGHYIITLNGTDSRYQILADIVGQMIVLAMNAGTVNKEAEFLIILKDSFGDVEAVETWLEQREVVLDKAWYRGVI